MLKITLCTIALTAVFSAYSQNDTIEKRYDPATVINEKYGITKYQNLNIMLGGDTIRKVNTYPANGFVKDYYTSGALLHKGFYVEGKLKIYKNYFPDGTIERNFKMVDAKKSKMDIYYKNGNVKSKITYINNEAQSWEDYFPDGKLEFIEVYDKNIQYYTEKANYFSNGLPENTLVLDSKKQLLYTQTYFYENGKIKKAGQMKYVKAEYDYQNIGTWIEYDEQGKPIKEIKYASGTILSEKEL